MRFLRQSREGPCSSQNSPRFSPIALAVLAVLLPALLQAQQTTAGSPPLASPSPAASMQPGSTESPEVILNRIANSGLPERGAHNAEITIVFFDDFQCPYSAAMYKTLFIDVLKLYSDKVKIVIRPLANSSIHPWAKHAAVNASCLATENKDAYWDFTDYVHLNQDKFDADPGPILDQLAMSVARKREIVPSAIQDCLTEQPDAVVRESFAYSQSLGVTSVPTLFVNGEKIQTAVPAQQVEETIKRQLQSRGSLAPEQKSIGGLRLRDLRRQHN